MAITGLIREHKRDIALTAAGLAIGLTSFSSWPGLLSRAATGSIIAVSSPNTLRAFSAVAFTALQAVAESYLPRAADPLSFLNKAISVTVTAFPLYLLNRASFLLLSTSSSPLFMPVLTIGTAAASLNSVRDVAIAVGIFSQSILALGSLNALLEIAFPGNKEQKQILKEYARFAAIFTVAIVASFYFHQLYDPFFHIGSIAASILSPDIVNIKTFALSFFAILASSYYSSMNIHLITALYLFFHFDQYDLNNLGYKKLKNLHKRVSNFNLDVRNKIKQFIKPYIQSLGIVREAQAQIKDLEKRCADLSAQKEELRANRTIVTGNGHEVQTLQAKVAELEKANSLLTRINSTNDELISDFRYEISDLNRQRSDLIRENEDLKEQNGVLHAQSQVVTLATFAAEFFEKDCIFREIVCGISKSPTLSPVVAGQYLFEEEQIRLWIKSKGTCPLTREPLALEDIKYLPKLKTLIEARLEFYRAFIEKLLGTIPAEQNQLIQEAYDEIKTLCPKLRSLFDNLPKEDPNLVEGQ